ncbi:hypothetical protein ACOSQ3_031833 [Xanthoceras sorbifolium]
MEPGPFRIISLKKTSFVGKMLDIEQYFQAVRIPEREQEHVKEFSSLMLDIQNMSEEDKLFNFMYGLQTWAQAKLRRQGVKDVPSAMVAAEGLVGFRISSSSPSIDKKKFVDGKKGKNKDWKKRVDGKKKKESESTIGKDQNQNKLKTHCYFICNSPHCARDCPKKEKINALI